MLAILASIYAAYYYVDNMTHRLVEAETQAQLAHERALANAKEFLDYQIQTDRTIASLTKLSNDIVDIKEELGRQNEIFTKHDWDALFNAKSGLMLRRFNDGTARVFKEFEALSSDTNGESELSSTTKD